MSYGTRENRLAPRWDGAALFARLQCRCFGYYAFTKKHMSTQPRVLIVSEHASARFGGEAALPLHYFRVLRRRGYNVWLITHARTREELSQTFPGEHRIVYVEDAPLHVLMWRLSKRLPGQIAYFTTGFVSRLAAQLEQRKLVRALVAEHGINLIHQPMPVSPREPSLMYGFGVPVVIGPMNGGMEYPPAFARTRGSIERVLLRAGRFASWGLNRLLRGKHAAALLLVANERTRRALPPGLRPPVVELVENGVDVGLWNAAAAPDPPVTGQAAVTTFVFLGRLVDWKAVDLLLQAFKRAAAGCPIRLLIIGDGSERARLQGLAVQLDILARERTDVGRVFFVGWLTQEQCAVELRQADCLVLSSLLECGGAVVLEAMCAGKPVIATAWGGPLDYLDPGCGVLIPPDGREALIQGFADAMTRLAAAPELRREMGRRGREKVMRDFDWEVKVDRVIALYDQVRSCDPSMQRSPAA
jgi:glycosyltransferase involved in cell wall biosynthesis